MGWDGQALAEGGVGRGLWSLMFKMVASLAVAGLSGGNWLLQGKFSPLQVCCTRPSFNGAAALKCFFLSSSFLFSSCLVLNKNKKYYRVAMSIHIIFTLLLPMRDWRWLKRGLIKVWHFHHSKLCYVNCEIGLCLLRDEMKHSIDCLPFI